ncbi:MAG: hypothetical protein ACRD3I_02435, partial [Terriglobales bacterium]
MVLIAMMAAMNFDFEHIAVVMFLSLPFAGCTLGAVFFSQQALEKWKQVFTGGGIRSLGGAISASVQALAFLLGTLLGYGLFSRATSPT